MKVGLAFAALAPLLLGLSLNAREQKLSDARIDGLIGPVQSVSTKVKREQVDWRQPDGPSVASMVSCEECEYDRQGNRTKMGQIVEGEFRGEIYRPLLDKVGAVTGREVVSPEGDLYRRDVIGPYGITEQDIFEKGNQISQSVWIYDSNGHLSEFMRYDRDGILASSSLTVADASGHSKEQWDFGVNGRFSGHFAEIYEPKTDCFTFTTFNEDGSIKLKFMRAGNSVTFYSGQPSEQHVFGDTVFRDPVGKTREAYRCFANGNCDHIFISFVDETRRDVRRVEWRDPVGELKLSADYDYERDPAGNWTKRNVWVWSPELGEQKLYETDYRTLTYWGS